MTSSNWEGLVIHVFYDFRPKGNSPLIAKLYNGDASRAAFLPFNISLFFSTIFSLCLHFDGKSLAQVVMTNGDSSCLKNIFQYKTEKLISVVWFQIEMFYVTRLLGFSRKIV